MKKGLVLASLLILSNSILVAGDTIDEKFTNLSSDLSGFTIGAMVSNFNSTSHETVYIPQGYISAGRRISELTWKAENVKLLGVDASYNFSYGLGFYAGYKKNISTGDGVMNDLDWVDNSNPDRLTHWSHHDNTDVNDVTILDLGLKYGYSFEDIDIDTISSINTWVSLGYKQEKMEFNAYDGYGNYLGTPVSFSGIGITYKQEYKGPYLGVGVDFKNKKLILNLSIKYSPYMSVEYSDRHHKRIPAFTETTNFDDTNMISYDIGLGYTFYKHQTISLSYEYTEYDYVRGDRARNYDNGTVLNWKNSAAIDSKKSMINLAYKYAF